MAEPDAAALAVLVVDPGAEGERSIPVQDRLVVGRHGADSADPTRRLEIDHESVSRTHLEIHLYPEQDTAWVVDLSRNGTRLNDSRIERSVPVQLRPGDRLRVGPAVLEFRSERFASSSSVDPHSTVKDLIAGPMVMVVGDVVSFSTMSQYTEETVLLEGIDTLYSELRQCLARHHGLLSNYAGDAFFASWELASRPDAAEEAVSFALESNQRVREIGPALALRDPSGEPIRMGWGISLGPAAMTSGSGRLMTVLGDATNVAFRLSAIAGRDGWSDVIVTKAVQEGLAGRFDFTEPHEVAVKGRSGNVAVYGARSLE
jgi:class 3 adenylate cyclase